MAAARHPRLRRVVRLAQLERVQRCKGLGWPLPLQAAVLNEAHTHLVVSDEMDESMNRHATRTYLFDMTDLDKPVALPPYDAKTMACDHNEYVVGNFLYQANYSAGLRILDISQIAAGTLKEVGFFDTMPSSDNNAMYGAWTSYPFFKSGIVLTRTQDSGLYITKVQPGTLQTAGE